MDRRNFLKFGLGSVALSACSPRHIAKVYEMFQKKPYPIEKNLRSERFSVNTSNSLRRYKAFPYDPHTRESELVTLARKERIEESFAYVLPENVWYEMGIQFRNDPNVPDDPNHGHKHEPVDEEYVSRTLQNVAYIFSGEKEGIPKASSIFFYHYHPVYLRAKNIFKLGDSRRKQRTSYSSLVEWAYSSCLNHSPPSAGDFSSGEVLQLRSKNRGISLVERVADHSGVWQFSLGRDFLEWLKSPKVSYRQEFDTRISMRDAILKSHEHIFYEKHPRTIEGYKLILSQELKKHNLPGNALSLEYWNVCKRFSPTEQQFMSMLKSWNLLG